MSTVQGGPGNIVKDGLVLYLDAANPRSYVSGSTIWNDISRAGNTGTLTNGPTFDSASAGSIVFDGSNDYVELLNTSNVQFTNFSQVTIESWINAASFAGGGGRIIYAQYFTGGNISCGIYLNTSGNFIFGYRDNIQNSGGSLKILTSTSTLSTNKIYNLTATFEAGIATRLYINGIQDNDSVQSNNIASLAPDFIRIARLSNPSADFYNGKIYSVRAYNRALTASEILQNYNSTKTRFGL